jgi:SAM-dependent methyltransferase
VEEAYGVRRSTIGFLSRSSSNHMRATSPSEWPTLNHKMCWRRQPAPVSSREKSHLRIPAHARVVTTDLKQPMLDHAAAKQPPDSRIIWQQADALALPFEDHRFDVVACQFGVMFFPDKVQSYRETLRVLKPGGHFLFNTWDRIAENEFAGIVTQVLAAVFPQDPPDFIARTPHSYFDVERIRDKLVRAGFTSISVETRDDISRVASPHDVAIAYCQGTPLRNEIEARDPSRIEEATQKAAEALVQRFGSGPIEGRIRAHVITAIR